MRVTHTIAYGSKPAWFSEQRATGEGRRVLHHVRGDRRGTEALQGGSARSPRDLPVQRPARQKHVRPMDPRPHGRIRDGLPDLHQLRGRPRHPVRRRDASPTLARRQRRADGRLHDRGFDGRPPGRRRLVRRPGGRNAARTRHARADEPAVQPRHPVHAHDRPASGRRLPDRRQPEPDHLERHAAARHGRPMRRRTHLPYGRNVLPHAGLVSAHRDRDPRGWGDQRARHHLADRPQDRVGGQDVDAHRAHLRGT